ncbi:hypothetical protein [Acinetobacter guillouiae]|uniref:hypothetical protein n=1 Tax=Acinetobacter guillouiae TaxID=106649 RepID=UPI001CD44EFC|nr:hypothetical protein [Acinetobacter guillouiae]
MTYLLLGIYFFVLFVVSNFFVKKKWELKMIIPLVFLTLFFLIWLILQIIPYPNGRSVQYFVNGDLLLNNTAWNSLSIAFSFSVITSLLLLIIVFGIRNGSLKFFN